MTHCQLHTEIPDYLTYILVAVGCLIIIVSAISNISLLMFIRHQYRNNGAMFFFKIILVISMLNVAIGQPLELVNILWKTRLMLVDIFSNIFLFFSFSAIYHCITCQTIVRYYKIKGISLLQSRQKKTIFLLCFTAFVTAINSPLIYNICQIIIERKKCQTQSSAIVTVVTMVTWIVYCSLIIFILTRKVILYLKQYEDFRKRNLSKQSTHTMKSAKRLKIMKKIWIAFSIIWLPYGIVNIIKERMSTQTYESVNAISRIIAFTSFIALPTAYYVTDRRYATYIQEQRQKLKALF